MSRSEELRLDVDARSSQQRPGNNSSAELSETNDIRLINYGRSPTNEEDARIVCERLIRVLNLRGAEWVDVKELPQDSDCDCSFQNALTGLNLNIQVVRADTDEKFWKDLNAAGHTDRSLHLEDVADGLRDTLAKKVAKYPPEQRQHLLLLLDANRLPSHTFMQVIDNFQQRHLAECRSHGFREVWLVGASDEIVFRLDDEIPSE